MSFLVARWRPTQAAACRVCRRSPGRRLLRLPRPLPPAAVAAACGGATAAAVLLLLCVCKVVVY